MESTLERTFQERVLSTSLPPTTRHLLLTFFVLMPDDSADRPTLADLSRATGLTTRAIRNHLDFLVAQGWVVKLVGRRANRYDIAPKIHEGIAAFDDQFRSAGKMRTTEKLRGIWIREGRQSG